MTKETKGRRTVILVSGKIVNERQKLWAYGYAELATLLGMTEGSVRVAVSHKRLDPTSLASICSFWKRRRASSKKQKEVTP